MSSTSADVTASSMAPVKELVQTTAADKGNAVESKSTSAESKLRWKVAPLQKFMHEEVIEWKFPAAVGNFTLRGRSRAADATGFLIPELAWSLDAGCVVHDAPPSAVFVTHTHTDHVHHITHLKGRRMKPQIFTPEPTVPLLEAYLSAAQMLTDNKDLRHQWEEAYKLVGVKDGERHEIKRGSDCYVVDVFRCLHTVPCVGFAFSEVRKRLKPEYASLKGSDIGKLRKLGVDVSEGFEKPLFVFCGDTSPEVFKLHPWLLSGKRDLSKGSGDSKSGESKSDAPASSESKSDSAATSATAASASAASAEPSFPVVITECTFVSEELRDRAHKTQHTCWADLQHVVAAHPQTLFILTHFSHQHKPQFVRDFFEKLAIPNVLVWL